MNPIIPTVGRVVYFTPSMSVAIPVSTDGGGVCAALITAVHNKNCVNLAVFDANGNHHAFCSVNHVSVVPTTVHGASDYHTWDWMPYQKGQAAKTEQLEAKLGDAHQKPSLAYCQQTGSLCNAEDLAIEQQIQAKGLTAPRLTPDYIDSKIKEVEYILPRDVCKRDNGVEVFDAPLSLQTLTFCILTLENGFTVTGESACASPENFDAEIGKKIAYQNAREKIWQLEGYLLRQRLHDEEFSQQTTPQQRVLLEKHDLDEKIENLSAFLSKPKPDFVSEAQWGLLSFQIHHMKNYREVLRDRLIDFGVIAEPLSPHNTINS